MAGEQKKVYTEQEVRDVIKRMDGLPPCGEFAATVREILEQDAELRNRVEGLECGEDWIVVPLELWNRNATRINAALRVLDEEESGFRQIDFPAHGYQSIKSRILNCVERVRKAIRGEKDGN